MGLMKFTPALMIFLLLGLAQIGLAEDDELRSEDEPMQLGHRAYVSGDYRQAARIWTPLAEQGLAQAQFYLSNLYTQGEGVEADPVAALSWLTRAATAGHAAAQFNLGNRHYQGLWVKQDYRQAWEWWGKAAEQGVRQAAFNIAGLYYRGQGVEKDRAKALYWYRRAAGAGSLEAKVVLAKLEAGGEAALAVPEIKPTPASESKAKPKADTAEPQAQSQSQAQSQAPVVVGTPEESATWIKQQQPDHYTVQVYAANNVPAVGRFIRDLEARDRLAVFGFARDGKPYFAVIQGSYASFKEASAKAAELTGLSTWVRDFASIRKVMVE
jgi:hypothetical protein